MKHHILKLALGALALAGLGFAGYKFMQRKKQEVVVQNYRSESEMGDDEVAIQSLPSQVKNKGKREAMNKAMEKGLNAKAMKE